MRKRNVSKWIGYAMMALLVFVAASQSTDQYIFAEWFVPEFIAHLLSAGMTGLLVMLLVAEQFKLSGFARWSSMAAIVLLLVNQAMINVVVNMTVAKVNPTTLELLGEAGLSNYQSLLLLSVLQGVFRPLLEMLLWPVVTFVLVHGKRASVPFKQTESKPKQRAIAQKAEQAKPEATELLIKQVTIACDFDGCDYEATETFENGNREQAEKKAKRRVTGHSNRAHSKKVRKQT
jgi:hypothetical protein